ncbi:MAG: CocE/NonD family hydrolase [Nocardioides sp.]
MSEREVRIALRDGVSLAATVYLPDPALGPQPCLLEALPYRKDDQTSGAADYYRGLRDRGGYAVCRVDVRGTGSSSGDALDEYQIAERADLAEVMGWLASQDWCDGQIGMFGTSYSGFNSLQLACEGPPELKAICAIYATDDRWTDDVHWRGGALRLVDQVDYNHYMTAMNVLPPVPAVWGEGWRAEWLRRLETNEPWLVTWLREHRHGAYWNEGSVRLDGTERGYERLRIPTMIIAGWADGYRNNSFRTLERVAAQGVPHRLLAGPWAHAYTTTAMPGPRVDEDAELLAWFDHHLRGRGPEPRVADVFVRASTRPEPDLDLHEGYWLSLPSVPPVETVSLSLDGPKTLAVAPDVGTAAWIDCAGHLPWGLSLDQRLDDARSLTWDFAAPNGAFVGHPVARLRLRADAPEASLSVKLCDVFPDGTSALITRGTLDLRYRDGVHGAPRALTPGETFDVELALDACAYHLDAGHLLRVSVAGADWPNTIAPPAPVSLTVEAGALELPLLSVPPGGFPTPELPPGAAHSSEEHSGRGWTVTDDVLARVTRAETLSEAAYDTPYGGRSLERYEGRVEVDRRTFDQSAWAATTFELSWPGVAIQVRSELELAITAAGYDVSIETVATEGSAEVSRRSWADHIDR